MSKPPAAMTARSLCSVQLGLLRSPSQAREKLEENNCRLGECAMDILKKMKPQRQSQVVELVVVSVENLGFPQGATFYKLRDKAQKLGFRICPVEVGPALRLTYKDQPRGEVLCIAMEAVVDSEGIQSIFEADHDFEGLWLRGCDAHDTKYFHPKYEFVFWRE